jgi:hypothetical protein
MKKCDPITPFVLPLEPDETHLHTLEIAIYAWEKGFFFMKKKVPSLHAKLHLRGHLTNKRFILEPEKPTLPQGVIWGLRILSEIMEWKIVGTITEIGQEQDATMRQFASEAGAISFPYENIEAFEIVEPYMVSMLLKGIPQEYFERLTFVPYGVKGADALSKEFVLRANSLLKTA